MSRIIKHLELRLITLLIFTMVLGVLTQYTDKFEAVAMTEEHEVVNDIQKGIIETVNNTITSVSTDIGMTREDIELIALITMAEAENQPELGKRLVIDTILNRIESDRFADTAKGVIYAKNQFECVWNGRVDRCEVREDICQLVIEELHNRTNSEVLYFRAGHYHNFGTPVVAVADHYFSTY